VAASRLLLRSTCSANFEHSHPQALPLRLRFGASRYGEALRRDESPRRVCEQGQGLSLPHPSQFTGGGPTPCRRRLNIHRQCPKIGMQKPAYPTDSMLRGGNGRAHGWQPQSAPALPQGMAGAIVFDKKTRGRIGDGFPLAKHVPCVSRGETWG